MQRRWKGVMMFLLGAAALLFDIRFGGSGLIGLCGLVIMLVGYRMILDYAYGRSEE